MSSEKRQLRNRFLRKLCITAAVLAVYYIFTRVSGLSLPCVFYELTGLKCPGCGMTHMMTQAARFEWRSAFMSNPLAFILLPAAGVLIVTKLLFMPDWLDPGSKVRRRAELILIFTALIYAVIRNIAGF